MLKTYSCLLLFIFILMFIASFNLSDSSSQNNFTNKSIKDSTLIQKYYPFNIDSFFRTYLSQSIDDGDIDEFVNTKYIGLCPSNPFDIILLKDSCFFQYNVFEQNDSDIKIEKFTTLNKYKEEKLSIIAQNNESSNNKNETNHSLKRKNRTRNGINYASNECGAKVIGANPEAYHPNVVLTTAKDGYMLNPCSSPRKWIIIELCEEIGIEEIQIGNYEYFSSIFKDVQILGSNQYPTKYWDLIGNYTAKNERVLQSFRVTDDPIWYKFIKVRFLSHWGQEFYCPVSEIRVYGLPIAEKLNAQLEQDTEYIHRLEKIIDPGSDAVITNDEQTQNQNLLPKEEIGNFKPGGINPFNILINDLKQTKHRNIQSDINEILKESNVNEDSMNFEVPKIEDLDNKDDDDDDEDEITKVESSSKPSTSAKKSDILSVSKVFEKVVEKIKAIETKQSLHSGYLKNITLFYYEELINLNEFFSKRYNSTNKEIKELKQAMSLLSNNSTETNRMVNRLINELNEIKILMENRHSFFMIQSIATSLILSLILCFSIVYLIMRFNVIPMIKSKSLLVLNKRKEKVKVNVINNTNTLKTINRPNGVYLSKKKKIEKEGKKELKRSISF